MVRLRLRFAIDAHHLLPPGVRHARQNAGLGDRAIGLVFEDPTDRNALVAETTKQQAARFVIAD